MPQSCVAWGCTERARKGSAIEFYRIPACPNRRSAWTDAVKRKNWTPSDEDRLCGKHFLTGKFTDTFCRKSIVLMFLHERRSTDERSGPPGLRSEHFRVQTA
ncbi:unnamed protein product [Ixodes persulcatus]